MKFAHLQVGDQVKRLLAGVIVMPMVVIKVDEKTITCNAIEENGSIVEGEWKFDRDTGVEEDEYLGWGRTYSVSGSKLLLPEREKDVPGASAE
jgi:hypothetical protein